MAVFVITLYITIIIYDMKESGFLLSYFIKLIAENLVLIKEIREIKSIEFYFIKVKDVV